MPQDPETEAKLGLHSPDSYNCVPWGHYWVLFVCFHLGGGVAELFHFLKQISQLALSSPVCSSRGL